MIPRSVLFTLVFALPLLVVTFAVVMGGHALAQATGDATGAQVLWWVAMGCLMLTCVDLVLLIGVLGARSLGPPDGHGERDEP
jgi:hypothetical protein